jgi:hypothetical protein
MYAKHACSIIASHVSSSGGWAAGRRRMRTSPRSGASQQHTSAVPHLGRQDPVSWDEGISWGRRESGACGGIRSAAGADGGGSPAGELTAAQAIWRNPSWLCPIARAGEIDWRFLVWPGERGNGESRRWQSAVNVTNEMGNPEYRFGC